MNGSGRDSRECGLSAREVAWFVAAAVLSSLVFLPAMDNGFVDWDDSGYVYENTAIRSIDRHLFEWAFLRFQHANWHPLTWLSHAIDYQLWGNTSRGHHLSSVLLHAINTFLVMVLVHALVGISRTQDRAGARSGPDPLVAALLTGLLFGIHPVHVESVAWVSERKDLLSAFFSLLTVLAYLSFAGRRQAGGNGMAAYAVSLAFFSLALLSKPMAVTVPLVLLVLDWYPLARAQHRTDLGALIVEKIPFFVLSFAVAVLALLAQREFRAVASLETTPLAMRFAVGVMAMGWYLVKSFVPVGLMPYYPYPAVQDLMTADYLVPAAVAAIVTVWCFGAGRRGKVWPALWLFYAVTLLPVIGFVKVGGQAMADRYLYLAVIAPLLTLGLGAGSYAAKSGQREGIAGTVVAAAVAAVVVVMLSLITVRQVGVWKDDIALWTRVIEVRPRKVAIAYLNRGVALARKGKFAAAVADYTMALSISPMNPELYYNRANARARMGLVEDALQDYDRAIALSITPHPDYLRNREVVRNALERSRSHNR